MGPFCRSGYQIFLISLTRRRFMSSTSVLSTSHSEWKKLPPLAFLAATVPSFCFLDRRKTATFTFLVVYLLSFFHWLSVGKLLYLGKTLSLSENFAQSNCIWSTNLLPWLSKCPRHLHSSIGLSYCNLSKINNNQIKSFFDLCLDSCVICSLPLPFLCRE